MYNSLFIYLLVWKLCSSTHFIGKFTRQVEATKFYSTLQYFLQIQLGADNGSQMAPCSTTKTNNNHEGELIIENLLFWL